jgi:carboxymethylenebutenolidase
MRYSGLVSPTDRYESISGGDEQFDAFCAVPASGSGPGILLFQEIFGVNDNIRQVAERLAEAGYTTLAPDMFWRIERRFERKDESGMADAFAIVQQFDFAGSVGDITACHAHLLAMPECTGKIGAVGFCLGGALAFAAATLSRVDGHGIDAAVCYYGSGINDMLDHAARLDCPTAFHYGNNDAFIPTENIAAVEEAVSGRTGTEFFRYDAGHAFSNWDAPSMYNEAAAELAWSRTLDFFARHLGGNIPANSA